MRSVDADSKLVDILEYGQGYDDFIAEVYEAFNQFRNGYYGLLNFGDEWWETFNQDNMFDDMMKKQWAEIEKIDLMSVIDKMAKAMAGTYVDFDAFARVVIDANKKKMGFRHDTGETE